MRILSYEKKIEVLKLILEGCSVRTTERITGVQRDTIIRLVVATGNNCAQLHDAFFRNVDCIAIEFDELWSYVGTKQKNLPDFSIVRYIGDQYLYIAFERYTKAVLSYHVGKRSREDALIFLRDLRERVTGNFQLNSDKFNPYEKAVGKIFGTSVPYGQIIKNYDAQGKIKSVETRAVYGLPVDISTTAVERNNLTLRMGIKRLARKTNAFSKKWVNHVAAVSLFIAYYNFCRPHQVMKQTPAMLSGVTDKPWNIADLFDLRVVQESVATSA